MLRTLSLMQVKYLTPAYHGLDLIAVPQKAGTVSGTVHMSKTLFI